MSAQKMNSAIAFRSRSFFLMRQREYQIVRDKPFAKSTEAIICDEFISHRPVGGDSQADRDELRE